MIEIPFWIALARRHKFKFVILVLSLVGAGWLQAVWLCLAAWVAVLIWAIMAPPYAPVQCLLQQPPNQQQPQYREPPYQH
jgi:hypothetical protein